MSHGILGSGRNKQRALALTSVMLFSSLAQAQSQVKKLPILQAIDQAYGEIQKTVVDRHANQMTMVRELTDRPLSRVDRCQASDSFGKAIQVAITRHLNPVSFRFPDNVNSAYAITFGPDIQSVSLTSHKLCPVTDKSLEHLIGKDFVPEKSVVQSLNRFANLVNSAVSKKQSQRVVSLYSALMGCIAYEEALAVPGDFGDRKTRMDKSFGEYVESHPSVAKFFQVKNEATGKIELQRPTGVIAYIDRQGGYAIEVRKLKALVDKAKAEGKYNKDMELWYQAQIELLKAKFPSWPVLGIFQFTPDGFGNIRACIESWNEIHPQCSISKGSKDSVAVALASPRQNFNTFCGVQKIVHSFYSQVNTSSPLGTDLSNLLPGRAGSEVQEIKPASDRCVSIVSRGGKGRVYSHFGPLRNSVKDNLGHVVKCMSRALDLHL